MHCVITMTLQQRVCKMYSTVIRGGGGGGISKSCWISARVSAAAAAAAAAAARSPPLAVPPRTGYASGLLAGGYKAAGAAACHRLLYTTSNDIANMAARNLAAKVKSVRLSSGYDMPMVGLGCYFGAEGDWKEEDVVQAVKDAISVGYRALDVAAIYGTEPAVGKGIKAKIADGTVTREDIFITTKLSYTDYVPEKVKPALERSLKNLDVDYIDLYLIHFPFAIIVEENAPAVLGPDTVLDQSYDHLSTWKVLEECVKEGKIRSIGISNFNSRQVQNMVDNAEIKPAVNQIEIHPYLRNEKLVQFCQARGVTITAYTPLGQPHASWAKAGWVSPLQHPVMKELAEKYKKGVGQIALRYQIQRNITLTAKSSNPKRLAENLDVFDFEMSQEDMDKISALDKNDRINLFPPAAGHKEYPFKEEF